MLLGGLSEAVFLPSGVSDHSPIIVRLERLKKAHTSFKFFNMWCDRPQFFNIVDEVWSREVYGTPMFQLYWKLKMLKRELKKLNMEKFSEISNRVSEGRAALEEIQEEMQRCPTKGVFETEKYMVNKYMQLCRDEESFLR